MLQASEDAEALQAVDRWNTACGGKQVNEHAKAVPDFQACCKSKIPTAPPCNSACNVAHYSPQNVSLRYCPALAKAAVDRSVTVRGGTEGAVQLVELLERLACHNASNPITVLAIGGSVSAGPGGYSWLEYMRDHYYPLAEATAAAGAAHSTAARGAAARHKPQHVRFVKLATNAMGPQYMSACLDRHASMWGGGLPDVVIAEYAVNDVDPDPLPGSMGSMELLLRRLQARGVVTVLLHHFAPFFMVQRRGDGHLGTQELRHETLARQYKLTSASLRVATGLPSEWAPTVQLPVASPCAFSCGFADQRHPNPCGQRWLAQLATEAVWRTLHPSGLARSRRSSCATTSVPAYSKPVCWSVVGDEKDWNLLPSASGTSNFWRLTNLKKGNIGVQTAVYKMTYLSRAAGSRIVFRGIDCGADATKLRVMHLIGGRTLGHGRAQVEINGVIAGETTSFVRGPGTYIHYSDFQVPRTPIETTKADSFKSRLTEIALGCRRGWWPGCWRGPKVTPNMIAQGLEVSIRVLNKTDHPVETWNSHGSIGFSVSALICLSE